MLVNNTIAFNGRDGIDDTNPGLLVQNNLIYGSTCYGINCLAYFSALAYNGFGANGTADTNGCNAVSDSITITGNPFNNSGSGDYSLNSTAGGSGS